MPPRKEPKETVVYPSSKRKAPPFKPQRPSKVPRIPTTESESTKPNKAAKPTAPSRRKASIEDDNDDERPDERSNTIGGTEDDSEEELAANPLASRPAKTSKTTKPPPPKRKPPRQPSPMSVSSDGVPSPSAGKVSPAPDLPPQPSQSDSVPHIPQPLLIRLLHEAFADKTTKIDKHAIQVLQKYFEVFVREAVARAKARKKEDVDKGGGDGDVDVGWLEFDDLEKVAAGMMLDF